MPQLLRFQIIRATFLITLIAGAPIAASAQISNQSPEGTFKRLTIDQLTRIDVTTASKHIEPLIDAPAAVYIITADDIERSGITTLPEALRLAAGVIVARFDNHTWGISARGFNISTANKMVVMIDGRSVYTPLFSGVFWDVQDLVLADIDRIEVIRGPGGTLWGANAVNGVINVITRSAMETTGSLVRVVGGSELGQTALRFGQKIGTDSAYRVGVKYRYARAPFNDAGERAGDPLRRGQVSFRFDGHQSRGMPFTLQGDYYDAAIGISDRPDSDASGGNVLGRAVHTFSSGSQLQLQAYYDHTWRAVPQQFAEQRDTGNVELQYHIASQSRHDVVVGVGYEMTRGRTVPSPVLFFDPDVRATFLTNVFAQDDITIVPGRLTVGIGSKFEHNSYTGFEYQPTVRARFTPRPNETIWGSVARAVRMPTWFDTTLKFTGFTNTVLLEGNPNFASETVIAGEVGYRYRFGPNWSFDLTGFVNSYDDLRSQDLTPPLGIPVVLGNNLTAETQGFEASIDYQPAKIWQIHGGYSLLTEQFSLKPGSTDITQGTAEYNDPRHQGWFRSYLDLPHNVQLDATVRMISRLPHPVIPAYAELSLHTTWRVSPDLDLTLVGDNLLHDRHPEAGAPPVREQFPRSIFGQVTWRR